MSGTPPKSTGAALVARRRRRGHPVFARPGRRRVQGLPRREGAGPRRPHGAARQDLPHQRLLDVHAGAQARRGRPAPQHRDRHQLRAHRPRGRARRLQGQGLPPRPLRRPGHLHELRRVRPGLPRQGRRHRTTRVSASARPSTSCTRRPSPTPTRSTKKGHSPCKRACAVHTSAQGYVALIADGRFAEAYTVASEPNPFAAVCGRVCTHKCETDCTRGEVDEPIAIAGLKRFVSDYAFENVPLPEKAEVTYEEKVAVVGAGPSGLTAARDLALLGYADHRLREQARARRHAALRHPRVPPAQGRPAAGHRPHPRARRRPAVRQGRRHGLHRRRPR